MTDKEKIKAEVLRLKDAVGIGLSAYDMGTEYGVFETCEKILQFIDSLPESPASVDLEEEVDDYILDNFDDAEGRVYVLQCARHFANWQKQQMMKDAVTLNVTNEFSDNNPEDCVFVIKGKELLEKKYNIGDKVKLLIVKED